MKNKPTAANTANSKQDVEYSSIDYNLNICYEDTQLEGQQKRGMYTIITIVARPVIVSYSVMSTPALA